MYITQSNENIYSGKMCVCVCVRQCDNKTTTINWLSATLTSCACDWGTDIKWVNGLTTHHPPDAHTIKPHCKGLKIKHWHTHNGNRNHRKPVAMHAEIYLLNRIKNSKVFKIKWSESCWKTVFKMTNSVLHRPSSLHPSGVSTFRSHSDRAKPYHLLSTHSFGTMYIPYQHADLTQHENDWCVWFWWN